MSALITIACPFCSGHLEFEPKDRDRMIPCPHCSQEIILDPALELKADTPKPWMTKCRDCGHELSKKAEVCPHCGARLKARRSIFAITTAVAASLVVLVALVWFAVAVLGVGLFTPAQSGQKVRADAKPRDAAKAERKPIPLTAEERQLGERFLPQMESNHDEFANVTWRSSAYKLDSRVRLYFGSAPGRPPVLRLVIQHRGESLLMRSCIIKAGEERHTIKFQDVSREYFSDWYERADEYAMDYEKAIAAIVREEKFSIRLQGLQDVADRASSLSEVQDMRSVLAAYRVAGGDWFIK